MSLTENPDGYLTDWLDWTPAWTRQKALEAALVLKPVHWQAIDFIRQFYRDFHRAPPVRALLKHLNSQPHPLTSTDLHILFPQGVLRQSTLLAGLPRPRHCL